MKISIENIRKPEEETILIRCYKVDDKILEIINFVKHQGDILSGYDDYGIFQISLQDIYYFESIDNKVFAYLKNRVYEVKCKLYELEYIYKNHQFFRCSKSVIINLLKIDYVKPALNGRFSAKLKNGEQIIISRQYVTALKDKLRI
ncbi:LytTR family transcriptional regulator [Mobilisporobacter senegalensis]|uniref:LytTR family transcriptional regulator n=1 Tax=Mobilisporobacter senegalensis TaxID=1329262 RepID=A0A3N1XVW8_9FIRM|nr:LytTR family DNA-binding domain-containing protein [Mobilisporobacter senegalensis]ROR29067.1 LytTR family transcriptional regulator [Mobilisporobacter senegalensis]